MDKIDLNDKKHTVLIVDDSAANIGLLIEILKDDYALGIAKSGEQALKYIASHQPDLILLDVMMPGLSGYDVCRQLKANTEWAEIPVIFITAMDDIVNMTEAFQVGAVDYMTKPVHAQEALARVRTHLSIAIMTKELAHRSKALEHTLEELRDAQVKLVETEKMAALGALVTGVAHEINTPVGTGITAITHMMDEVAAFREKMAHGMLTKKGLNRFMEHIEQGSKMVFKGLQRTAGLVSRFKEISVDQSPEMKRDFSLKKQIEDAFSASSVEIGELNPNIEIHCDEGLIIHGSPKCLSHILRNLIINSLQHGLVHRNQGIIGVAVQRNEGQIILDYWDNGQGMNAESQKRTFDPFYTTQRGGASVGLGMHIVYNLVTQKLKGTITCESAPGKGVRFQIKFPSRS